MTDSDSEKSICPTNLIEDIATGEDSFALSGGKSGQGRVADAIVDVFLSEDGGKIVGLEGAWGIGKSNVVAMVSKKLETDKDCRVLTLDTWAHDGDPLRRTFLETIVVNLQEFGWLTKKEWNRKIDNLSNRRRRTKTTTIPEPTKLGIAMAIALFLVPF